MAELRNRNELSLLQIKNLSDFNDTIRLVLFSGKCPVHYCQQFGFMKIAQRTNLSLNLVTNNLNIESFDLLKVGKCIIAHLANGIFIPN